MLTPVKAIRAKCMDCTCDQPTEIKLCPIESCPLFPYRFGKNPNRKLSEEQKEKSRERLEKARIALSESKNA